MGESRADASVSGGGALSKEHGQSLRHRRRGGRAHGPRSRELGTWGKDFNSVKREEEVKFGRRCESAHERGKYGTIALQH